MVTQAEQRPWLAHYDADVPHHVEYPDITLPEMLANLESGGGLAPLGLRRGAPRQRTLSATLDWSYELLDEAARQAWRQLLASSRGSAWRLRKCCSAKRRCRWSRPW